MNSVVMQKSLQLLKQFEGFKPKAYQDVRGIWTVGYGQTFVEDKPVTEGTTVTSQEAEDFLKKEIEFLWNRITQATNPTTLTMNQQVALISFTYNVGLTNFVTSTLCKLIKAGKLQLAQREFLKWDHAGKEVVGGLLYRRRMETTMFMRG